MRFALLPLLLALVTATLVGCSPTTDDLPRDGGDRDDAGSTPDADGDGIADVHEGRDDQRDTDGDGTPDYLDDDSDGDGIPDAVEAGDADLATPPVDSDGDGIPDFIDLDSDSNGIPDALEVPSDIDADGIDNYVDPDDDNDGIPDVYELNGVTMPPLDFDQDGLPDFQDRDSDNDAILDGHERGTDTDGDGVLDVHDRDSDNDGLMDAEEAGDTNVLTPPVDSDGDFIPDFRDTDSDDDGLADGDEALLYGTSPTKADTDDDGISDLIEIGAGTDPMNALDNPRTRGDFVFVMPYMEPPSPARDTLRFRTSIQFADVYFLFDASGSMGGEQDNLAMGVSTIIDNLTCTDTRVPCLGDHECRTGEICSPFSTTCIEDPAVSSCVLSLWTGAGQYGQSEASGNLMINQTSLQPDPTVTRAGIDRIPENGATEPLFAAVWAVVNPLSAPMSSRGCSPTMSGRIGCPGFREEAVRILVAFTDEASDGSTSAAQTATQLRNAGVTFIGVASDSAPVADMVDLANRSGSVDARGTPFVYMASADGRGIETVVTNAINDIVRGVPLRVTIAATDEEGDDGDSLQFIRWLEANTTGEGCTAEETEDEDRDGVRETYPTVTPGTPVCWDVVPRRNDAVMQADRPLVFRARLTVYGDGSPLDGRTVYFLVPPKVRGPGPVD